jgi:hypothetical protein
MWGRTVKTVIFTRTGFHHTSFINRLQERFEIACVVREAYPEQPRTNPVLSIFRNLFRRHEAGLIKDEQFLKKFSETWSAGFRYPMLKDYLRRTLMLSSKSGLSISISDAARSTALS